ncbi:MAG: tRNA (cytosine(32)/uridine(32)-2'-O)-methyltransferase TrmJ [Gammaproteobacteria bacterium]|nr:tRNA (cytosine(32)/uridine(32)-2'-O)-methyltransferase TrmJ [Gammaproteobacteria bacterium]
MATIRIVLIGTSHPGNIGAAARAMKTMNLDSLYLVTPKHFPDEEANRLASSAADVLDNAVVCETLDAAIADCRLVIGASARERSVTWPMLAPDETAAQLVKEAKQHDVALVFGRERTGLTNEELDKCHALVQIPANAEYSSLNLAAAVQVLSYEINMAVIKAGDTPKNSVQENRTNDDLADENLCSAADMENYFVHLEKTLVDLEFIDRSNPRLLMRKVRRLYNRIRPTDIEMNILRGILTATATAQGRRQTEKIVESNIGLTGIHHHSILIQNLDCSLQFYRDVLGLEPDPARPELPFLGAWLNIGKQSIHLLVLPNPDPINDRPEHGGRDRHVALHINNINHLISRLENCAVPYTASKSGRKAVFFRDPDGNAVEVIEKQ